MKRLSIIGTVLLYVITAQAIIYPTTSYEISNGWLNKWTGPETDIDFTGDPNLYSLNGIYGYAFEGNENIRSVRFERGLGDVCTYAFKDCPNLETIVFDNVGGNVIEHTWISNYAFYNCPKLSSVTFSEYTERVTGESFEDCPSLTSFSIDSDHPEWRSYNGIIYAKNYDKLVLFPQGITGHHDLNSSVVEIADYAFYQSHLSTIYLTNNLQSIGNAAFREAQKLTTVVFPNSLREIGRSAFMNCESLRTLILPQSIESIGADAFYKCSSLPETIKIPASVTTIGGAICGKCPTVKRFEVAEGNAFFSTREGALYNFQGNKLIDWPWGTIGDAVTIPDGTTIITTQVFQYAPMKEVSFPSSLQVLEEDAFILSSLEKVFLPEGVTTIGPYAFAWCPNLREIELPSTLTEIKNSAFKKKDDIHRVVACHASLPIGKCQDWGDLSTDTLYVPEESVDLYMVSPGWRDFGTILPIPVLQNYLVTVTQTYGNGLIIVYLGNDEIYSGTEVQEGSVITIKVFLFPDYELGSLLVNGEEVETIEEGIGVRSCSVTVTDSMNISANFVYVDPLGISKISQKRGDKSAVYDLQGRSIAGKQKGMLIVKTPNGVAKKFFIK